MQCESSLWSNATDLTPLLNTVYSIIHQSIDVKIEDPSDARLPGRSQRPSAPRRVTKRQGAAPVACMSRPLPQPTRAIPAFLI